MSRDGYPFRDTWPWVEGVLDAFGPDRTIWASDWPLAGQHATLPPAARPRGRAAVPRRRRSDGDALHDAGPALATLGCAEAASTGRRAPAAARELRDAGPRRVRAGRAGCGGAPLGPLGRSGSSSATSPRRTGACGPIPATRTWNTRRTSRTSSTSPSRTPSGRRSTGPAVEPHVALAQQKLAILRDLGLGGGVPRARAGAAAGAVARARIRTGAARASTTRAEAGTRSSRRASTSRRSRRPTATPSRRLHERLPGIDTFFWWTNDSGSGFCWYPYAYAGPNGPSACRDLGPDPGDGRVPRGDPRSARASRRCRPDVDHDPDEDLGRRADAGRRVPLPAAERRHRGGEHPRRRSA